MRLVLLELPCTSSLKSKFAGIATVNDLTVAGFSTVVGNFDIQNSSGQITAGVVTATTLNVGAAGTIITTQVGFGSVGIGSTLPTATLDVGGHTKFKTYSEAVSSPSISANEVTLDLSVAQSFTITASDDINAFVLTNAPSGSTSFTVKILQDSTGGHSVGIDTFKNSGGTSIPVYWLWLVESYQSLLQRQIGQTSIRSSYLMVIMLHPLVCMVS